IEAQESSVQNDVMVEVMKYTETELTVQVSTDKSKTIVDEDDVDNIINQNSEIEVQKSSGKCTTMSESSGDEMSLSPAKKGILKHNGRVCRSLSESSVDDYVWPSSLDMMTLSGSESCIPEEAAEEERETKKTVRFNDIVSQKTYRTNSSILGQRKKNQRKTRNKRRCQERRASESENSEGEAEKEREKLTDDEKEMEGEDVIPAVQDALPLELQVNTSKPSPKGKRKNRKGADTSKVPVTSPVEFGNDLIFDLDM
ncbi:hypothetical protein L9F63_021220, partial [Diploptera punctata]